MSFIHHERSWISCRLQISGQSCSTRCRTCITSFPDIRYYKYPFLSSFQTVDKSIYQRVELDTIKNMDSRTHFVIIIYADFSVPTKIVSLNFLPRGFTHTKKQPESWVTESFSSIRKWDGKLNWFCHISPFRPSALQLEQDVLFQNSNGNTKYGSKFSILAINMHDESTNFGLNNTSSTSFYILFLIESQALVHCFLPTFVRHF